MYVYPGSHCMFTYCRSAVSSHTLWLQAAYAIYRLLCTINTGSRSNVNKQWTARCKLLIKDNTISVYISCAFDGFAQLTRSRNAIDGSINSCAIHRCFTKMGHYPQYPQIGALLIDPYIIQHYPPIAQIHQLRITYTCIYKIRSHYSASRLPGRSNIFQCFLSLD